MEKELHLRFGKGVDLALYHSYFMCFVFPLFIVCNWVSAAKGKELFVPIWPTLHRDAYQGKSY